MKTKRLWGHSLLNPLGSTGHLLLHGGEDTQNLIGGHIGKLGAAAGTSLRDKNWDVVVFGQNTPQTGLSVATPRNLVVQVVNLIPGGLGLPGIQRFTGHAGGPHLLNGVAVAVADGLDDGGGGLALHIRTGQVGGVVANNLRQTHLVVGVVGDGLGAGVHLAGHGEALQGGELRVLHVVGLRLHIVQLTGEEDGRLLSVVEVHLGGSDQRRRDVGGQQRLIVVLVVSHGFLYACNSVLNVIKTSEMQTKLDELEALVMEMER